ncbi:unnamed protein product [Tuber melanosporum]|uniref:(Perigord truffle) hypothetical protein n=1 Tax=Tuber melanosporum (strain Mel28) TaxID=656061 RepID=D5GPD7_TUBMM|nr:uncharacterized protein GSTUM_00011685001 [Tuber melanosporum]CAZ86299.1 unnamed protein product [Tuber melanosporum]
MTLLLLGYLLIEVSAPICGERRPLHFVARKAREWVSLCVVGMGGKMWMLGADRAGLCWWGRRSRGGGILGALESGIDGSVNLSLLEGSPLNRGRHGTKTQDLGKEGRGTFK